VRVARLAERCADLTRDVLRILPDQPGREPESPVPIDIQAVVAVHVVPPLQRVRVLRAIDLRDDLPVIPQDIDSPSTAVVVAPADLPTWNGEPVAAHDLAGEVEFRQRLRAAGDVAENAGH
jgi:hypothetical protein